MSLSCVAAVVCSALLGMSTLSGRVLDESGTPLANARVFIEPGFDGTLREARTDASGAFRFEDVAPGATGVFAIADGYGFGGRHLNVAVADALPSFDIPLERAASISGEAVNHHGNPIAGAYVTRIALLGEEKVGIPLSKLAHFGFPVPCSGEDGAFTVPNLPRNGRVALKVGHPAYAQEGTADLDAGATGVKVTLHAGLVVMGGVVLRKTAAPIAGAIVTIRNTQPPHDTAITTTDGMGIFSIRLKPGVYLYRARGGGGGSPGWEQLVLTEKGLDERLRLVVSGTGTVRGKVGDARTGAPVAGARVSIVSSGNMAAVVRTGATGEFSARVSAGENAINLESAPGYLPSKEGALRVIVEEGATLDMPGFWLMPIPEFKIQVVGEDGRTPAPGALVTVLRPRQFGCNITDDQGWTQVAVGHLPEDGKIVGMAEAPNAALGALFSIGRESAEGARVQLLPLASVEGRVKARRKPVTGAIVGALFPEDSVEDALLLWRTVTDEDGRFAWNAAVPGVPFCCAARAANGASERSKAVNLAPGEAADLGDIGLDAPANAESALGGKLAWYENELRCGSLPDPALIEERAAVVVYCLEEEAEAVVESLAVYAERFGRDDCIFAVVVRGAYRCADAPLPVLGGAPPGPASTYVIGRDGSVVLETFGLPPLRALRGL